jgi:hypothetical protein
LGRRGHTFFVVRKLLLVALIALLLPSAAPAKRQGDLRICGANGCRTIDRHLGHDTWPLLSALTGWPANSGPAAPAAFFRITIVPLDAQGRPDLSNQSQPIYFVPSSGLVRNDDGRGSPYWTRLESTPEALAKAAKVLRPFPAPRLTRAVVGNRVAKDPQSYLRLFRIRATGDAVADPAGPRPEEIATTDQIASYWKRVGRVYRDVQLVSRRDSPWSDWKSSLWIGRRLDLVMRDSEIVRIPHALAERIRRGESLR